MADSAVEIAEVEKRYGALRPLRIRALAVAPAERVAIVGPDAGAAEVLVNLITGASVPDHGEVRVFGRSTRDIVGPDEWLESLDRFGIVSERAVLLEGATLEQNLALPFTLSVDPMPPETSERVKGLAGEVGLDRGMLTRRAGDVPPEARARAHLARALALEPGLLIFEHPTALLPPSARQAFAADLVRIGDARKMTAILITQDRDFARRAAHRTLVHDAATGNLSPITRRWFRSG
jgi:ABC-type transporter Mla maintaining outer membrane lipid asymmetry ATPase subunit MlaF